MKLLDFLVLNDNWNGNVVINNAKLHMLASGKINDVINNHDNYLFLEEDVCSFGYNDDVLTVRIEYSNDRDFGASLLRSQYKEIMELIEYHKERIQSCICDIVESEKEISIAEAYAERISILLEESE